MVSLGHVVLNGTTVQANASRHKAMVSVQGADAAFDQGGDATRSVRMASGRRKLPPRSPQNHCLAEVKSPREGGDPLLYLESWRSSRPLNAYKP